AQPRAEDLDELEHHVGVIAQKRHEVAPLDDDKLTVGHGDGVGGARTTVEQGNFSKNLALVKDVEHNVLAVGRRNADLDRPDERPEAPGAGTLFREDGFSTRPPGRLHVRAEMLDDRRGKIAKQRMVAEQGQLVARAFRRPLAAWNRHESSPRHKRILQFELRSRTRPRQHRFVGGGDSTGDNITHDSQWLWIWRRRVPIRGAYSSKERSP